MSVIKNRWRMWQKLACLAGVFVLIIGGLVLKPHANVAAATNGRIAFESNDDQFDSQIFTSNADGSNLTQLTTGTLEPDNPSFSPDGTKIAFAADPNADGNYQIFIMNADGSGLAQITHDDLYYNGPAWSADGTKIAVSHSPDGVNEYIYTMNADGSGLAQITSSANPDSAPSWNPNGTSLIYDCYDGSHAQICSVNADSTNQHALTSDANDHETPTYSPDGTHIATGVNINPYSLHIVVMNADGTSAHTVVTASADAEQISWSPDGSKLLFEDEASSPVQLTYVNVSGGGDTVVTTGNPSGSGAFNASWQPLVDTDGDGYLSTDEAAGPNNGDANGDGTADKSQPNVTNFINSVSNQYTVVQSTCTSNHSVTAQTIPAGHPDAGFAYPEGLLNFTLTCPTAGATATVSLYFYGLPYSNTMVLRKYNATAHTYQTVPGVTVSSATIGSQTLTKATYKVTDGGPLDQDGTANGTIVDPVGLTTQTVNAPNTGLGGMASSL